MTRKRVAVVGAGPGGLTASMILAHRGYDVDVFEKEPHVGGRNAPIRLGPYTFDTGPTFLMMKSILEEMFRLSGGNLEDYLTLRPVDPLYRLQFADGRTFLPSRLDRNATARQIERLFPGNVGGYWNMLRKEKKKHDLLLPCIQVPYEKYSDLLTWKLFRATPYADVHTNLFSYLGRYFDDPELRICFSFQAKYLGMSPWKCPATFSMLSYAEHGDGLWHPLGGLHRISSAMAQVVEEQGGRIHLATPVREIVVQRREGPRIDTWPMGRPSRVTTWS